MNDAIARWFDPVIPGKFGWFASGFPGACSNGLIVSYTVKTPVETYTSFAFFRTRSGSVLNVLGGESVGTLRYLSSSSAQVPLRGCGRTAVF